MTDADLDHYVRRVRADGIAPALNYYRAADVTWHEMAPWRGAHIKVPAAFIAGDRDVVVLANPDIVQNFPKEVPDLRGNTLIPNCGHWTQQERPEETNRFLDRFPQGRDIGRKDRPESGLKKACGASEHRCLPQRSANGLQPLDRRRVGPAAGFAHRLQAEAAVAFFERRDEIGEEAAARSADGVAERTGAARQD